VQILSERLRAQILSGGTSFAYLEVLQAGIVVFELRSVVLDGGVSVKREHVHRDFDLTLDDRDGELLPDRVDALLEPYGTEIRPWRGMRFWDGTEEAVPLGTMRLEEWTGDVPRLRLKGYDRAYQLKESRFVSPWAITGSPPVEDAIRDIVETGLPGVLGGRIEFNFAATGFDVPNPTVFEEQSDRMDAITQLATAAGCRFFFDPLGNPTLVTEVEPAADEPVWSYVEGNGTALLSEITPTRSTEGLQNGCIATSDPTGDNARTFRGEYWDYNPASPTYTERFGRRPQWFASPLMRSDDQCRAAARKQTLGSLGLADGLSFSAIVNPAHESGDPVDVQRLRAGVDELHILDSFTIPFRGTQTMPAATRVQRVAA
jgi:hypothetical protein